MKTYAPKLVAATKLDTCTLSRAGSGARWFRMLLAIVPALCVAACTQQPAPAVPEDHPVVAHGLNLNPANPALNTPLHARLTYENTGEEPVTIHQVAITAVPPGESETEIAWRELDPVEPSVTLEPGQQWLMSASRTFTAADPAGAWILFGRYRTGDGAWVHTAPVAVIYDPVPATGATASVLSLSSVFVTPGHALPCEEVHAEATLKNAGESAINLLHARIVAQSDDALQTQPFTPGIASTTLAPGASTTIRASWIIDREARAGAWSARLEYALEDAAAPAIGEPAFFTIGTHAVRTWSAGYYAAWEQSRLPPTEIDFGAITHLLHFAVVPRADGSLDDEINLLSVDHSATTVAAAHAAGRRVLLSVGGAASADAFRAATKPEVLPTFVKNLVTIMTTRGYDGLDLDWEPLTAADEPGLTQLVEALRIELDAMCPRPELTAAAFWEPAIFGRLASLFDRVNVMSYVLSGAYPGWVSWHNAALHAGGGTLPSGGPLPSVDHLVKRFLQAGVPTAKLGIGIPFHGAVWTGGSGTTTGGVTTPRQSWTTAPLVRQDVSFREIMEKHYDPAHLQWDPVARVPYLSFDHTNDADDRFISFDDAAAIQEKIAYVKGEGLGGFIIWELSAGYRPDQPPGQRDPLLQAVKAAFAEEK